MKATAKKKNKGFSLVELIIVIAIMVALIAVLAPQFVKYVQHAHDAVMTSTAEDVLAMAKSEYSFGRLQGEGVIHVETDNDQHLKISFESGDITYGGASNAEAIKKFEDVCGIDHNKLIKTNLTYTITIANSMFSVPKFEMKKLIDGQPEGEDPDPDNPDPEDPNAQPDNTGH